MSKLSDQFSIHLPLADASTACHSAIDGIGWKVKVSEPTRIVPTIGVGLTRNPSKIEVQLAEEGPASTTITLDGSIWGVGPIQKRHLQGELTRLREAIETEVQAMPSPAADGDAPAEPEHPGAPAESEHLGESAESEHLGESAESEHLSESAESEHLGDSAEYLGERAEPEHPDAPAS
jgi:hypothetical protein